MQEKENASSRAEEKAEKAASMLRTQNKRGIPSDTDGSYTGESRDGTMPVQYADDLYSAENRTGSFLIVKKRACSV